MANVQLRLSIINTPDDLSPLKLRGWLLQQAREIQEMSSDYAYTRIKLFLSKRQRFAFTQRKLDVLLQGIVDKYPAIHSIELAEVEKSLTNDQIQDACNMASAELNELSGSLDELMSKRTDTKTH